ncbi:MAG: hypothetical protein LBN34_03310 [Clostridiales Family XIII bacterium]|jgi:hypothetical protein|nr:hypothetical protein [Clostridiales Family XIII bacterium]
MAVSAKQKDLNLILAMDRNASGPKASSTQRLAIIIIVAICLILGGISVFAYLQIASLKNEKADLKEYVEDPSVVAAYDEANGLEQKATKMQAQSESLKAALLNISSYPDMTEEAYETLYSIAGERISLSGLSYERTTGILSFGAQSDTVTGVPIFATQLRLSGLFDDVYYQGYSKAGEDGSYSFQISCLVHKPEPALPDTVVEVPAEDGGDE